MAVELRLGVTVARRPEGPAHRRCRQATPARGTAPTPRPRPLPVRGPVSARKRLDSALAALEGTRSPVSRVYSLKWRACGPDEGTKGAPSTTRPSPPPHAPPPQLAPPRQCGLQGHCHAYWEAGPILSKKSGAGHEHYGNEDHCARRTPRWRPESSTLWACSAVLEEGAFSQHSTPRGPDFVVVFQLQPGVRQLLLIQQCPRRGRICTLAALRCSCRVPGRKSVGNTPFEGAGRLWNRPQETPP